MSRRPLWRLTVPFLTVLLLSFGCAGDEPTPSATLTPASTAASPTLALPAEFRNLYAALEAKIAEERRFLAARPAATTRTVFAAELLPANGNIGEGLLRPGAMESVRLYLDRLQALGVGGVSVQISDPLLWPSYPRAAEYLAYYRAVAAEVRGRGLVLMVETGPVFAGTAFSPVQIPQDFWGTAEAYLAGRRQQLALIAREVRPDYLSLGHEPDTEGMLTGLALELDAYMAFLRATVAAIGDAPGVKVGAGTGSWHNPAWVQRMTAEPRLDFINIHLYPLSSGTADFFQRAVAWADAAKAAGKEVVVGETWLYKLTEEEVRQNDFSEAFRRDNFSFWARLDAAYVALMGEFSRRVGAAYVSFFWSKFFFGYVDYGEATRGASVRELTLLSNRAATEGMVAGVSTATGDALKRLNEAR